MDSWDYGYEQHMAAVADAALTRALEAAEALVAACNEEWTSETLDPRASVELKAGAEDQPLFVFTIWVALDESFDPQDWPGELIERLKGALRGKIVISEADSFDWYVTVNSRASATA